MNSNDFSQNIYDRLKEERDVKSGRDDRWMYVLHNIVSGPSNIKRQILHLIKQIEWTIYNDKN